MSEERHDDSIEAMAWADGRRDLVSDAMRARVDADAALREALDGTRDEHAELSVALRRASVDFGSLDGDELESLVSTAMAKADAGHDHIPARSLWWGTAWGLATMIASGTAWIALQDAPTSPVTAVSSRVRLAWSLGATLDRLVDALPGGWSAVAVLALVGAGMAVVTMRWVERGRILGPLLGAMSALLVLGGAGPARAYDVEGAWPSPDPLVDVDVEGQPLPLAIEQATRSCGLGLVYGLDDNRPVTLHAHGVPLREVLDAMLGATPARVRNTGHLVVIERRGSSPAVGGSSPAVGGSSPAVGPTAQPFARGPVVGPAQPFTPMVGNPSPVPSPSRRLEDVITFGGDAFVPRGVDVRDVVTMGGDARIEGRAFGNVVTMGGDADVEGVVVGDVVTMGGDIQMGPDGVVHGQLESMGGGVSQPSVAVGSVATMPQVSSFTQLAFAPERQRHAEFAEATSSLVEAAVRYALLFVGALLLAFFAPDRFGRLQNAVRRAPLRSLMTGTFANVGAAFAAIVLAITLLGIPVAFVLVVVVVLVGTAGLAATAHLLGQALPVKALEGRPVWRLAAGVFGLFLMTRVPFLGWIVFFAALGVGTGAVILTRLGKQDAAGVDVG